MWSKKWYLKRNISCDAHLLNELLETDVLWDDAIVVSAGKLSKLWDSLIELRSSVCERRLERTVVRPALLPVKTAQFTQFFCQVWRHTVKSLSLTESVQGAQVWDLTSFVQPPLSSIIYLVWKIVKEKKGVLGLFCVFNPLNAVLNSICYLLALLGARHFLHVSRIRAKSLTLRLLMSYIYDISSLRVNIYCTEVLGWPDQSE